MIGQTISHYEILEQLGGGGMGVVYKARDTKLNRLVALKFLPPELSRDEETNARFMQEAQAASALDHPNVCTIYEIGEAEDGRLFIAMAFYEGQTLKYKLHDVSGRLSMDQVVDFTRQVAAGLSAAHKQGIVHRDIKPANIMVTDAGHIKILDFGLAKLIGGLELTKTGSTLGTTYYMSPEQIRGHDVGPSTDVWSLGVVLYQMLAGERPFTGDYEQAVTYSTLNDEPRALEAYGRQIPDDLSGLVLECLSKDSANRPTTENLARRLEERSKPVQEARLPAEKFSQPSVIAIAAVVLVVALLATAWFINRQPGAPVDDSDLRSIAVLPFVNTSDDAGNEYFSEGLSEELLNLLAKIPELKVAARTSSFSYKDKDVTIAQIGEELNVAHVLEGSVRKAGTQVRITAQLVQSEDGFHLWSDSYDRTLDDIFAIQEEIAVEVVTQLKITLLGDAPTVKETDPEVYALYLQARYLTRQGTSEAYEQSIDLIQQSLEIDPGYPAAWDGLATNYVHQANNGLRPIDEGYRLAREATNRALAIDPAYAPARARLGWLAMIGDGDLADAARHFERALELDPTNMDILNGAARLALNLGRFDEAIMITEYVVVSDPVSATAHNSLSLAYFGAGRLDEAIASARTALSLSPGRIGMQSRIGWALLLKGEPEAALAAIQQETDEGWRLIGLVVVYHSLGQASESDAALAKLIDKYEQDSAYNIAYDLAFRGEVDRAFEWLDKAVQYRDPGLSQISSQNLFVYLHDDPRWLPFLESIGKSPEQLAAIEFEVKLPE